MTLAQLSCGGRLAPGNDELAIWSLLRGGEKCLDDSSDVLPGLGRADEQEIIPFDSEAGLNFINGTWQAWMELLPARA